MPLMQESFTFLCITPGVCSFTVLLPDTKGKLYFTSNPSTCSVGGVGSAAVWKVLNEIYSLGG